MDIELTPRALLMVMFKHKLKVSLTFSLIMFMGLSYIFSLKPLFVAHGTFLVKFGQSAVPNVSSDPTMRPTEVSVNDRSEMMQSYLNIIHSYELVYQVIDKIGFDKVFPLSKETKLDDVMKERLVNGFAGSNIYADVVDRSNVIELNVSHKDPKISYILADAIMTAFLEKQAQLYNSAPSLFLQQRLVEASTQRDDAQTKLSEFKKSNNITDIDTEIDQLLQEKRELSNISFGSTASSQTTIANLITELETKKAELEATYRSDSVVLKKVNDSLKVARGQLGSRTGNGASFSSKGISVDQRIEDIDGRINFLETNRGTFNELKQNAETTEERAKYFKQRVEDARLNHVLNQENISRITVIDKPVVPNTTTGKNKKLLLLAFLMLATFCSVAMIVISEFLDDRVSSPEQLEHICPVPLIATFSISELK